MRPFHLTFALILASVTGGVVAAENEIPRYFEHKFGGELLWISAPEAITSEGKLRPGIRLSADLKERIKQWHEQEAIRKSAASEGAARTPDCDVQYGHRFTDGPDEGVVTSSATLDELATTRLVISGRVTAAAPGIHVGIPYTVLQIDQDSHEAVPNRVFLMYPRGRLRFEGMTFCNENPSFMDLPSIGDAIVFIASYPLDSAGTLFSTSLIVYETESGVAKSKSFRLEPEAMPRSVRGFTERLRAVQQREKNRRSVSTPSTILTTGTSISPRIAGTTHVAAARPCRV